MTIVSRVAGIAVVASLVGTTMPAWAGQPVRPVDSRIMLATTAQIGQPAAVAKKAGKGLGLGGGGMSGPVLSALGLGLSGTAIAAVASKGKSKASPD